MCEGQSWGFCSSVTELYSSLSETKTQRWIKHMTSLFQCWLFQHLPASMLLFAGVLNTHTHALACCDCEHLNNVHLRPVCLSLCTEISSHWQHPHPPPPCCLHCYYMTSPSQASIPTNAASLCSSCMKRWAKSADPASDSGQRSREHAWAPVWAFEAASDECW